MDLGDAPPFLLFRQQVDALDVLQHYCTQLVTGVYFVASPDPAADSTVTAIPKRPTPVTLVRTSLSSPWITVLADAAQRSRPVAYAVGSVFALQRLLRMLMDWQVHRQELDERRRKAREAELAQIVKRHLRAEVDAGTVAASRTSDEDQARAAEALAELGTVLAAEMVDRDDPRAVAG